MAARGHVQDPNDRRLRPIYDYLDNGNNKMAIQQADKLLKKHKDLYCAKVLKAIGLQRTGKQDEAFTLAQEVTALEPTDDNSLQALTILYREMHRPELVTKLYEVAVKKVPSSEEYHSHLFMAYARVGEYKKMQQAGMALYKIVPKNPYYFWSVMSLVMQAISERDEKLSKTMFLPLAERMVAKMVKEEKIEAEAEVQLYFMILERLGKYVEALEVVRGKLGEKLTSELQSRENKCMALYKKLDRWPECNALSRKLLLTNPDDWQFFLSYFDSLFHVIDESWSPPEEGEHSLEGEVESSVAQAIKFVLDRISAEETKGSRQLRGPYLARLELIQRLRQRGSPEEKELGEPHELMFQYFEKFGDKPCCISDLKIFLDLLAPDQHVQFINRVMETVLLTAPAEGAIALPADTKALQRHLCVVQLARSLGLHHAMDREHKLSLIHELKTRYRHGLEFGKLRLPSGKSSLKTELQYSDVYCLLAAHVLIDMWAETGEEWSLWQCLGLLEEGLIQSPSNAQFKLLLILIFCRLGAFEPVVDLYSSLDAKHVQHDTIGYLLTRYAESLGQFAASSQSCNFSLRFFHSNQKDTSEYIIQAYKYGAFEKIPEFIAFRNRLNSSLHFAQVRTERMLLDLFLEANILSSLEENIKSMGLCPEEDAIPWNDMRDNRDLTVLASWDPKDRYRYSLFSSTLMYSYVQMFCIA
ncbi:N-alpha-acetyltransferase 25, NatB auxiliary subunit-like isoform X1 [Acipenser oxyrinchus oxyrinchus]|uniref:N-alpha-acetyltransferase 25, NatB auxiliary subunit n=1 Tax=Acipenser oxyrinchus oxyrinchus TaxID=40147 RepID=A0AAD8CD34_ACIOX|nr:N-alpha-acetyltransferase 25, NatB auxiliary subunit-like isoform X1 [Acipenser oxyrinchus oxyrinchus]